MIFPKCPSLPFQKEKWEMGPFRLCVLQRVSFIKLTATHFLPVLQEEHEIFKNKNDKSPSRSLSNVLEFLILLTITSLIKKLGTTSFHRMHSRRHHGHRIEEKHRQSWSSRSPSSATSRAFSAVDVTQHILQESVAWHRAGVIWKAKHKMQVANLTKENRWVLVMKRSLGLCKHLPTPRGEIRKEEWFEWVPF